MITDTKTLKCHRCGEEKPVYEFHRNERLVNRKRQSRCKDCVKIEQKEYKSKCCQVNPFKPPTIEEMRKRMREKGLNIVCKSYVVNSNESEQII